MRSRRKTKVPVSASGCETGTDKLHSDTWVTYAEAKESAVRNQYDGVGFVIPEGYVFLDMDHVNPTDPFVKLLLERFHSYAEYSVSGTGIHIYGKCSLDELPVTRDEKGIHLSKRYYTKNPVNGIELYLGGVTNRFAVYTENPILNEPLRDCTQAVLTTLNKDMLRNEKAAFGVSQKSRNSDDDLVVSLRNQKNGEKFSKLYDKGDFSDYPSQSEADASLCAMLAFRTGPDPAAIDRLFRGSALYRQKWERSDYRENTIAKGIEACHGMYHISKMEHPDFICFHPKTGEPNVSVPLLSKYVREHLKYILVRDYTRQELQKYIYQDGVYQPCPDQLFIGYIKKYVADYDEKLVKIGQINEVLQDINTDLNYVRLDKLNANESLINFKNGLLRVTAEGTKLLPHTPDCLSTIQIPCCWTGSPVPTPVFDSYMRTLTNGDSEVEHLLLEVIGVILSNVKGWRMKKALFMVGEGDTGKSVLKDLVERILGKGNYMGIDLKDMESRFGSGTIYGTRMAGSSDMGFISVEELKTFKKITGGDSLFAEFKGQQPFEFTYNGFLWFCMNRLPKFGGDDGKWVYNRIMIVNCPNVIPNADKDNHLLDKLYEERDGIVYKAVKALQVLIANDYWFSEPNSVIKAREAYLADNSTVISFFNECMGPKQKQKESSFWTTGRIYHAYQTWCRENNNGYCKTAKEFRNSLSEYLQTPYHNLIMRSNGNSYYTDYSLTEEASAHFLDQNGYGSGKFMQVKNSK